MIKIFTITFAALLLSSGASWAQENQGSGMLVSGYAGQAEEVEATPLAQEHENEWRWAVDFGGSWRSSKSVSVPAKKLRNGIMASLDANYFQERFWGLGGKFSCHYYSHSTKDNEDMQLAFFIAPSAILRIYNNHCKGAVIMGIALGYIGYTENINRSSGSGSYYSSQDFNKLITGAMGANFDIGYDIRLSSRNYLGFKISAMLGDVFLNSDTDGVSESLNAIDLSVGLRF